MEVASRAPVSKGASSGSGRSRRVSWERGRWPSQPLQKRRDGGCGGGPGLDGGFVNGQGPERGVGGGVGRAHGDKQAGRLKAEDGAVER